MKGHVSRGQHVNDVNCKPIMQSVFTSDGGKSHLNDKKLATTNEEFRSCFL